MRRLRGKKLLWMGTNADVDKLYLIFEGFEALVINHEPTYLGDARGMLKEVLSEHIDTAENVMVLKTLLEGMIDERKSESGASQKAGEVTSQPGSGS